MSSWRDGLSTERLNGALRTKITFRKIKSRIKETEDNKRRNFSRCFWSSKGQRDMDKSQTGAKLMNSQKIVICTKVKVGHTGKMFASCCGQLSIVPPPILLWYESHTTSYLPHHLDPEYPTCAILQRISKRQRRFCPLNECPAVYRWWPLKDAWQLFFFISNSQQILGS